MNSCPSLCKDDILRLTAAAGAFRTGIAAASPVDDDAATLFARWIADGRHGGMAYLDRYHDVRRDPRQLLPGAQSIICCAFNYHTPRAPRPGMPQWAEYALGDDYHEVVRCRLGGVAEAISEASGAECRVAVDTAPLRERYWAARAGVGFIGRNNQLIIPGAGSRFFLGEIITTLPLAPDAPIAAGCGTCRKCVDACPGNALDGNGGMDARRCLSYLTIEHRGELPQDCAPGMRVYGCDECQNVCPHNRHSPVTDIPEFAPREAILNLTVDDILAMQQPRFSTIFSHSAIKRTKLAGLLRNAAALLPLPGE